MKLAALVLLVALVLGALVGVLMSRDPGYVMVAYDQVAVETSLWVALLALAVLYAAIRLVLYLFVRIGRGGDGLRSWHNRRRTRAAREQTTQGLLRLAEGQFPQARKLLESAAPRSPIPLVNYLEAARAAHEAGDPQGRDALLRAAEASTPGARIAAGLTRAELQRAGGQWRDCLATLRELRRHAPRQPRVLRLLVLCYQALGDWQAVLELLPELPKAVRRDPAVAAVVATAAQKRSDEPAPVATDGERS